MFKKLVNDVWVLVKCGNMLLLVIGVLIGVLFNVVISLLVNDVIMVVIVFLFNV